MWLDELDNVTKILIVIVVVLVLFIPSSTRNQILGCVENCKDITNGNILNSSSSTTTNKPMPSPTAYPSNFKPSAPASSVSSTTLQASKQ